MIWHSVDVFPTHFANVLSIGPSASIHFFGQVAPIIFSLSSLTSEKNSRNGSNLDDSV